MFEVEKELVAKLAADSLLTMCGPDDAVTCSEPHWRQNPCCQKNRLLATTGNDTREA
jgi:hypothetical protein